MSSRAIWIAYVVLLVLSIPWYVRDGSAEPFILGFPLWCVVSLSCYVAAAALTVWAMDRMWADGRHRLHGGKEE